jgi:transcriptional regulator of arginine metabolism
VPGTGAAAPSPSLEQLLPALVLSVDGVGTMVVMRTTAGSANTVAMAVDRQQFDDVLGTIAGDDTILLVVRSDRARRAVMARLREAAGIV